MSFEKIPLSTELIETYPHGNISGTCDACIQEKQSTGKEEVDPEEILRSAVDGITPWDTPDSKYRIITIRNEKGELVTVRAGSVLDLLDEEGQLTGEMTYFVGYAVTDPKFRQKGIAREAYISALLDAAKDAESQGKKLKFAIGECAYTSEKFWNSVGWRRLYSQIGDKKEYSELKYIQPGLDYEEDTGELTENAGKVPEHLMVDSFGQASITKEELKKAYEAMLHYNVDWPEQAFSNKEAWITHKEYIDNIKEDFKELLDDGGKLIFLSAEDREKAKSLSVTVYEHTEADHGNADKEDF